MKKITICFIAAILLITNGEVFSQAISLDGTTGGISNDTIFVNQQVEFDIRINVEGSSHSGFSNGFRVYSTDGAEWTSMVGDTFSFGWGELFDLIFSIDNFSVTGSDADTIGFGGVAIFGPGFSSTFNEITYSITIGPVDPIYHKKHICLDSTFYPPTGEWIWAGPEVIPSWDGPHCFTVIDPNAPSDPSSIVLSSDFLDFTAVEGESAPPSQTFDILTDQDPFNFTLNEAVDWIYISPLQGTSGQAITTSINPTGLTAGTYIDSIEVVAPTTVNSPQWVVVTLVVEPPPPTIAVSQSELFFNAVAGEANPDDKIISISNSNVGSADLNWSVSNSESWLSLSPSSGVNSGDVTVSVDITGLGFNDYSDTIIVTDPQATNDPVKIPVNLSVGSDLPLIAVDSAFNYIIVEKSSGSTAPPREILIYNGGAGGMTYSLSESSPRIFTLNPTAGVAPETVTVGFKVLAGSAGEDFFDTLWVSSPEAINSPFPVVFQFHYVETAAQIIMNDTVEVNVFECDQGAFALNPQGYFNVSNVSGGESYYPQFDFESELFSLEFENNTIPEFVSVVANDLQLPLGTYYDTITVSAINTINSPQNIIVKYNVIPGVTTPKIVLPTSHYIIPTRKNEGPRNDAVLRVLNLYGGCMEWNVDNNIPWLFPSNTSGNVPGDMVLVVNAINMSLGTYVDTMLINAPLASNSPQKVAFELKVWELTGDFNWDGVINLSDLVLMINYFFADGVGPEPEWRVADVDCNSILNLSDIVRMIDYMFKNGPILCGNP